MGGQVAAGFCSREAVWWRTPLTCRAAPGCSRQPFTSETHHQPLSWESQATLHAVRFPTEDFTFQNHYSLIWEICIIFKLQLLLLSMIWTVQILKAGHSSDIDLAQWTPTANFSIKTRFHGLLSVIFFQQCFTA